MQSMGVMTELPPTQVNQEGRESNPSTYILKKRISSLEAIT